MPLRSTSSGISSAPAVSMLWRRVSSVNRLGGVVLPSFNSTLARGSSAFSERAGMGGASSSDFSSVLAATYARQPGSVTVLPLDLNWCPAHSSVTAVSE